MQASLVLVTGIAALCGMASVINAGAAGGTTWVYVAGKEALSLFRLDTSTGLLEANGVAAAMPAGFLAFSPDEKVIYALTDSFDAKHKHVSQVCALAVDRATGRLTELNRQPSGGDGACFVTVDPQGKNVLVANYSSATVAVLPLGTDGSLHPASCVIKQTGSSIDPARQKHAYAHSVNLDPSGRFAFVADLGADKLFIYRFDSSKGILTPSDPPSVVAPAGSGPRHFTFDPSGRFAYLINEMGSTVLAYSFDAASGTLKELQQVRTLADDFKGTNTCAEVQVHPSGKFLYASNRGDANSIAVFSIDASTGKLAMTSYQSTLGRTPRNFRIDPSGGFLIAANQDSNSIVLFRVNQETGALTPSGKPLTTAAPQCVKFLKSS